MCKRVCRGTMTKQRAWAAGRWSHPMPCLAPKQPCPFLAWRQGQRKRLPLLYGGVGVKQLRRVALAGKVEQAPEARVQGGSLAGPCRHDTQYGVVWLQVLHASSTLRAAVAASWMQADTRRAGLARLEVHPYEGCRQPDGRARLPCGPAPPVALHHCELTKRMGQPLALTSHSSTASSKAASLRTAGGSGLVCSVTMQLGLAWNAAASPRRPARCGRKHGCACKLLMNTLHGRLAHMRQRRRPKLGAKLAARRPGWQNSSPSRACSICRRRSISTCRPPAKPRASLWPNPAGSAHKRVAPVRALGLGHPMPPRIRERCAKVRGDTVFQAGK